MVDATNTDDRLEYQFAPDLWREVLTHRGQWVVLDDALHGRIVATGSSADEVLQQAEEQGVEEPVLIEVPRDETTLLL
jgi:hypothetical protein